MSRSHTALFDELGYPVTSEPSTDMRKTSFCPFRSPESEPSLSSRTLSRIPAKKASISGRAGAIVAGAEGDFLSVIVPGGLTRGRFGYGQRSTT
eukprot:1395177-Amorphochlora_amoeboformis.AAC.1